MTKKDQRSLLLSLVLGDGCLHYLHRSNKIYGSITIDHGIKQLDYQKWKAELIGKLINRKVKVRQGHRGNSVQVSACWKRFRSWRKFCYLNNKKSIAKLLKYIYHYDFALAVLLMDDGYVESSKTNGVNYGARFRIFLCDQSNDDLVYFQQWLKTNFDVESKIKYQSNKYPFIKLSQADSLKIWTNIRSFVLQFDSMKHKFRYIEQIYQRKLSQCNPKQTL
jgi:hypothetical protein